MGQPKTTTVGGGSAVSTANGYNNFLQGQVGGGSMGSTVNNLLSGNATSNPAMNMMQGQPTYGVSTVNMPNPDVNSARANAIAGIVNTQNQLNLANTNARYSSGGMSALGTGASMAAAQQNTIGQNQLLSGLQGVTQQDITNNLQYGQLNSQNALQAQGMQGQDTLSRLGLQNSNNLGTAQLQQGGMLGILQQLFGGLNGSNQLGTAQAQTVQTPSSLSQILSGVSGLSGLLTGMGGSSGLMSLLGLGGGGGGSTSGLGGVNFSNPGSGGLLGGGYNLGVTG